MNTPTRRKCISCELLWAGKFFPSRGDDCHACNLKAAHKIETSQGKVVDRDAPDEDPERKQAEEVDAEKLRFDESVLVEEIRLSHPEVDEADDCQEIFEKLTVILSRILRFPLQRACCNRPFDAAGS